MDLTLLLYASWAAIALGVFAIAFSFFVDNGAFKRTLEVWIASNSSKLQSEKHQRELNSIFDGKYNIVRGAGFALLIIGLMWLQRYYSIT